MRIIFVDSIDPKREAIGGKCRYVTELISKLRQQNIQTTLIGVGSEKYSDMIFNFIPILKSNKITGYKFLMHLLTSAPSLRLPKNAIIHTQRPDQMLPFSLFYRENPKICTLHGIDYTGVYYKKGVLVGSVYRMIENFVLKRTDKIIAVNDEIKDFYLKKYPWLKDKIVVIPIGINAGQFKPIDKNQIRKKYGFDSKEKIIMFVGRLEKEKNLDLLLRVFKKMSKSVENTRLVLVGDGREREKLKNLAEQLELHNITFMGTVPHDNIPEVLSCADVFTLRSLYESGPIVVQEAIACGVPCVTTNVGRVKKFVVNDFVGRVVEGDEDNFVSAIIDILNTDNEKIREECCKVATNFDFEKTAKQTIEVYESLLEERAK